MIFMRTRNVIVALLLCPGCAQGQFRLQGIVDLHVHTNPDSFPPRRTDVFEIATMFKKKGFRACCIKSHFLPTSQLAYVLNKTIPEVKASAASCSTAR
jgi:Family of unknown function (DUF6282)